MRDCIIPGARIPDFERPGFTNVAELHEDLREITRRARPEWKIDTPEMWALWRNGEHVDFYPYGESWRRVFVRMAGEVDQFG